MDQWFQQLDDAMANTLGLSVVAVDKALALENSRHESWWRTMMRRATKKKKKKKKTKGAQ